MADVNAEIGVNIDTSNALAQIKALQREIARFHTSVAKSSDAAALAQRDLQKNFVNGVNAISGFSAELRTVKTTAENFTDSLERNKFSMREYFRYSAASTKSFGRFFTSEFDTVSKVAVENVKRLQTQYIKMGRDANGAMKAIAVMPTKLDMTNLTTQTQLAAQRQAIFNQLVKQGSTNLLNFGKNTQWAGRQLMVGFTIPLMGLGSVATKTFMDMETAAIKFKKVYGDLFTNQEETQFALESIQLLGQEFTKYGIAVSQTVSLAAEAAAAGFQGQDLQAQVTQATRLQVLGQIDQQKALETTISLQNAFKLSSTQLAEAINFLNAVENQTVVSLDDITTAIPKAAPIVKELGGDVKDLAFFMAAMKEGGINASEGANALKSGLASLINPSNKAKAMLKGFGIDIDNIVEKNVGNLKATVIEFGKALDGLSGLQRQRAIEQLFGKFQQARLSALFDNVIKDGNQAARVLGLASSSVEELAALAEKELGITAGSAMNKFRKAVEDLKVALVPVGQAFLEVVTPILENLRSILDWFNGLSDTSKKVLTKIVLYFGGLAPVILMTVGLLANFVANGIKGVMLLRNGFLRLTGQSQILGEQTQYLTVEQQNAVSAAASLEQSHMRLQQVFTGEAGAIKQLIAEYQRMITAQSLAATRFPGMMNPGFKPKKYAKGVVSVPGPKGAGDVVPAMLSPGEAVIPADMTQKYGSLINGMIADNIPGYMSGKSVAFAHASMPFAPGTSQYMEGIRIAGLEKLAASFPEFIKVVSNLVVELPQALNVAMKKGINAESFFKDYQARSGKFLASAKLGGLDIGNPELTKALQGLEDEIGLETVNLAKRRSVGGEVIVSDELLADATRSVIDKYKVMEGSAGKAARALDAASNQVGQVRVSAKKESILAGLKSGIFRRSRTGKQTQNQILFGNTNIARESASNPENFYSGNPVSPAGTYKGKPKRSILIAAEADAAAYRSTIEEKTQDIYVQSRDRSSPHPLARQDGYEDGKAYAAARISAIAASQGAAGTSAAGTFLINPKTGKPFTKSELGAVNPAANKQYLPMPTLAPHLQEEKDMKSQGRFARMRGAIGERAQKAMGAGGGFGLSALFFSLSMLPGKFGQLAQSIMPAVFGLQALGMLKNIIGGWPTLLLSIGAGLFMLDRSAKKASEEIIDSAKAEAEARYGSVQAIQDFATFTGRALPSAREFSRNNRLLISASGEAVKRFSEFYGQKGNRSTKAINAAVMRGPEAGLQAAALDVAQRAAIFGLSPADIAANIKAAADLFGADQVKLKAQIQTLLAPNGKDITREPLTIDARINFLREQSGKKIEEINKSITELSSISLPDMQKTGMAGIRNAVLTGAAIGGTAGAAAGSLLPTGVTTLAGGLAGAGLGGITAGTIAATQQFSGRQKLSYGNLSKAAGYQKSINDKYSGGALGKVAGAGMQVARNVMGYGYNIDAEKEFKTLQQNVQSSTLQLSVAFTQEQEGLALLNQQYADGLITREQYDAQAAISTQNFLSLGKSSKKLVEELDKIDETGKLSADALKDLGDQAFASLKKANPGLFKKITEAMKGLKGASQVDIMMAYAQGSLTIADIAKLPGLLDQINGKPVEVAIRILANAGISGAILESELQDQLDLVNKTIKNWKGPKTGSEAYQYYQLLDRKKGLEFELKKIAESKVPIPGVYDTDPNGKTTKETDTSGKLLDLFDKELDALKKKRDALKDINDELDRQNQYQMKQMDLINQASRAKISGNYLQAAELQQQSMLEGAKFTADSGVLQLDRLISMVEERKSNYQNTKKFTSADKTFLETIRSGNYESLSPMPKTPSVGFNSKALGFAGSTTNIGGAVYTITMNISGENATDIANKVLAKLQILENKKNKTNKVGK